MRLKTEPLVAMCEAVVDCPHSTPVWTKSGRIVLRNQNIKSGRLDLSEPSFTDDVHFRQRIKRIAPRAGDIVITREAPMGDVCKIPDGVICCLGQRQVLLRPRPDVDADYLLYALQSPFVQNQILWNDGTGSTVSNIRIPVLEKIEVPRHGSAEKTIAKILSSIDRKIDTSNVTTGALEAIAQAIFKSWFVDFDPVKAKIAALQEGRDPLRTAMSAISGKSDAKLDELSPQDLHRLQSVAALFPDQWSEADKDAIPLGWVRKPLTAMIRLIGGGTPKRSVSDYWAGDIPWYSVKDAPSESDVFVVDTEEHITPKGLEESATRLLPVGTTIISARGTVGKLALTSIPMAMNQSCYGIQGVEGIGAFFNYYTVKEAVATLQRNTHGAVFDTITQATFETVASVVPSEHCLLAFEETVEPLMQQILQNVRQKNTLRALRDALLPRLLSGEITVNVGEHSV